MANKKINELLSRTPSLSDLMLVGDPSSGYSYKCTVTALATIIETDIADGYVTLSTTQTISGAKTFSNVLTLTSVANATTTQTKFLTLNGSNVVNYRTGAEVLSDIGGASAASLSGYVPTSRTLTINGTAYDLSANRSWSVGTVTSVAATAGTGISISGSPITSSGTLTITNTAPDQTVVLTAGTGISVSGTYPNFTITNSSPSSGGTVTSVGLSSATSGVTIGSTPITTSGTITLAIATASGTQQGLLSSTDWNTFNNKQEALTNPVTGTGTTNYIPKFTSSSAIGNSIMSEGSGAITVAGTLTANDLFANNRIIAKVGAQSNPTGAGSVVIDYQSISDLQGRIRSRDWDGAAWKNLTIESNQFIVSTGGSERMRLDASGNLGINTSSPTQKLTVSGASLVTGKTYIGTTSVYLDYNGGGLDFATNSVTKATLDASGNLGLGVTPSAWGSSYKAMQIASQSALVGYAGNFTWVSTNALFGASSTTYIANGFATTYRQNDGTHAWFTAPSGVAGNPISFTQAMTLNASGNLGLGTTTPLDVANYQGLSINGTNGSFISLYSGATQHARLEVNTGTEVQIKSITSIPIIFGTNNTERMRINNDGSFGFNSTGLGSRSYFFRGLSGRGLVIEAAESTGVHSLYLRPNASGRHLISSNYISGGAYLPLSLSGRENDTDFVLNAGNIGIGTTSPTGTGTPVLHINGTSNSELHLTNSTTGTVAGDGFTIQQNGNDTYIWNYENSFMSLGTNNAERMRITSAGEVLINTTSDAGDYKLQVNGNIYIPTGANMAFGTTGSIFVSPSTSHMYIEYPASNSLIFRDITSGTAALTLTSSENAEFGGSIKTASPSADPAPTWKLGKKIDTSVSLDTTKYVMVEIDGVIYNLALVTTN